MRFNKTSIQVYLDICYSLKHNLIIEFNFVEKRSAKNFKDKCD